MRSFWQITADCLWPARPDPDVYLRPLIVLAIVAFAGPEVFAAADMVALLDLLGAMLFLTALSVGFRAIALVVLTALRRIFFPAEWTALIRTRAYRPTVHGLRLVGANLLLLLLVSFVATLRILEIARGAV